MDFSGEILAVGITFAMCAPGVLWLERLRWWRSGHTKHGPQDVALIAMVSAAAHLVAMVIVVAIEAAVAPETADHVLDVLSGATTPARAGHGVIFSAVIAYTLAAALTFVAASAQIHRFRHRGGPSALHPYEAAFHFDAAGRDAIPVADVHTTDGKVFRGFVDNYHCQPDGGTITVLHIPEVPDSSTDADADADADAHGEAQATIIRSDAIAFITVRYHHSSHFTATRSTLNDRRRPVRNPMQAIKTTSDDEVVDITDTSGMRLPSGVRKERRRNHRAEPEAARAHDASGV